MDDSSEEEPTQESLVVSHCSLWRNNNRTQHPLFRVPFGHTEKYPTRVIILGVLDFHGVLCPIAERFKNTTPTNPEKDLDNGLCFRMFRKHPLDDDG